jgi:NSS family neurotransmitter:Na+ symporter
MSESTSIHGQWSSRLVFVLAATGSAVGLGNIWKFPYITGEYGGGAFVLVYLGCILLVGLPVMIAEILLGRRGRQSPINTMRMLAAAQGVSTAWSWLGWAGVITGFLILSFYSVIAGWAIAYAWETFSGTFTGASAEEVGEVFGALVSSPGQLLFYHTLFMLMTMFVVGRGVKQGLEKAVTILMPALAILLAIMVGYAMAQGAAAEGLRFLFEPDFSAVFQKCSEESGTRVCTFTREPLLVALGHAFFTLSLGMGAIMVYGSYMPSSVSITRAALMVVSADTLVALFAGMAIFPLVFANGLEPGSGPGLIFQTLPIAFGQMPGGLVVGGLFFVLLVFAAWSSSISLIEPAAAYLVENKGMSRPLAAFTVGGICWVLGIGTVLSFNLWSDYKLLDMTFFDLLDYLTANILLPLGGLLIAIFVGWISKRHLSESELSISSGFFAVWWFVVRFIAPLGIFVIFLNAIGVV